MNSGKVILGAMAGLAAGAILGILFAPEKGKDTRKKIADKGKESLDDIKHKYDDLIGSLTSKLESLKKDSSHLYEQGKNVAQNAKNEASKIYQNGKDIAEDAQHKAANQLK